MRKRIVIDIDGVLSEFNQGFRDLLIAEGADVPAFDQPRVWNWPKQFATNKQINRAWRRIDNDPAWWFSRPPHDDVTGMVASLLASLAKDHEVSFVTNRRNGRDWAVKWFLMNFPGVPNPQVTLSVTDKGPVLYGMQPDIIIEDKPDNLLDYLVECTVRKSKPAVCILVDRPYNQGLWNGVDRVPDTETALLLARSLVRTVEK